MILQNFSKSSKISPTGLLFPAMYADNKPLFCFVGTTYGHGHSAKINVHSLCGASQGNKGTRHKGTSYGYRALGVFHMLSVSF